MDAGKAAGPDRKTTIIGENLHFKVQAASAKVCPCSAGHSSLSLSAWQTACMTTFYVDSRLTTGWRGYAGMGGN